MPLLPRKAALSASPFSTKGYGYAIGAYLIWGLFPIYWKWLRSVDAPQLIGHRIGWSFLLLIGIIGVSGRWPEFRAVALRRRMTLIYGAAALLISLNWLLYVWAVNSGYVVETSLGYFINPLLSVLLGVIFLRERLRPFQWLPIGLATAGVIYLGVVYGRWPGIALGLAFTFGAYGLVKKVSPLGSLYGLTLETGLLFLPAALYLWALDSTGAGAFLHQGSGTDLLLMGAGVVTTIPLLLFAAAAQRIPLSTIGLLQYMTPTMQFLLGVAVYKEPFNRNHLIGFSLIWVALALFGLESYLAQRRRGPNGNR